MGFLVVGAVDEGGAGGCLVGEGLDADEVDEFGVVGAGCGDGDGVVVDGCGCLEAGLGDVVDCCLFGCDGVEC